MRFSFLVGVLASLALAAAPAGAASHRRHARAQPATCCTVPAGTEVELELAQDVTTEDVKIGDPVDIRLAAPLILRGQSLLLAGTPGKAEVIEASRPGIGGKAAKLVLAARYLDFDGRHIPLRGLQLGGRGRSNVLASQAVGLSSMAVPGLGVIGLAVSGGQARLPAGTHATAVIDERVTLPSQGRATAVQEAQAQEDQGPVALPAPPPGKAQIVFFRGKGTIPLPSPWFRVREQGRPIGKLTPGSYFVAVVDPGVHDFTTTLEPELKDHLKLEVGPGQTYYVEGVITRALLVGQADLFPSDRTAFEKAARKLKARAAEG